MTLVRLLRRLVTVTAVAVLAMFVGVPSAWAHVTVTSDHSWRGGVAKVTFSVPNESETGSPTTQLKVVLPNVTSAHTELMPGWTATLDHDIPTGTFRSIIWTAVANGGIPADQFALFRIEITLPDSDSASFPATQTYADGKSVHWDQPPLPDGSEPEHPAPMLTLTAATAETNHSDGQRGSTTGGAALWLAGAALAVSVVSLALTVLRWRRS